MSKGSLLDGRRSAGPGERQVAPPARRASRFAYNWGQGDQLSFHQGLHCPGQDEDEFHVRREAVGLVSATASRLDVFAGPSPGLSLGWFPAHVSNGVDYSWLVGLVVSCFVYWALPHSLDLRRENGRSRPATVS
jgi:hypothetical protein